MTTPTAVTIVCGCRADTTDAELGELIRCGVGEVYAGYVPGAWLEAYGMEVSPNRRYTLPDQITDPDRLRRLAETARERGAAFVLALNEHYYTPGGHRLIDEIVATGLEAGATGFIVANLALLARLRAELGDRVALILSQEAGLDSAASARVFVEQGATRLIFARETMLSEMQQITAALSDTGVAFEAFVAREYCMNSSSRCFVCHGHTGQARFCVAPIRRRRVDRQGGRDEALSPMPPGYSFDPDFQRALRDLHRCGLCAIAPILGMGVRYLKVPGRSSSAIAALSLIRRLLDEQDLSPEACRRLVDSEAFCSGHQCYYAPGLELAAPPSQAPVTHRSADPRARRAEPVLERDATAQLELYLSAGTVTGPLVRRLAEEGLRAAAHRHDGFFAPWEREVALGALDALDAEGLDTSIPPARVQLGLEMCALRCPGHGALSEEIRLLQEAGLAVSLVLPVAYEAIWEQLLGVVEAAIEQSAAPLELVVNDIGLLRHAARHWPARLATGRLFNRMKRDQFATDASILPAGDGVLVEAGLSDSAARDRLVALRREQQAMYGHPYLSEPFYTELLEACRVDCVGLDLLPTPLSAPLSPDFEHALYLPWTNAATTRACPLAGSSLSYPTQVCARPCRDELLLYDYGWDHRLTVQRGAGVSFNCTDSLGPFLASAKPAIRRLVFELGVPW